MLTDSETDRQTDRHTHTDRQTDRQIQPALTFHHFCLDLGIFCYQILSEKEESIAFNNKSCRSIIGPTCKKN